MSSLKRKNISGYSGTENTGAELLAFDMKTIGIDDKSLPENIREIETDILINAPKEWNFYKPLSEEKLLELIASIEKNGLIHPIVVWENVEIYTILSGHNRVRAYRKLYDITRDEKYKSIPCVIKKDSSIRELREIIIDSNWVARELSTAEKSRSVYQKYVLLAESDVLSDEKLKYEKLALDFGLSSRQIHRYLSLNNVIPPFLADIDSGRLSMRSGNVLAMLSKELQQKLSDNYYSQLTNTVLSKVKRGMAFFEIEKIIKDECKTVNLSFNVPSDLADEIKHHVDIYIKSIIENRPDKENK